MFNINSKEELAWLAGLLEGEGSFYKEWDKGRSEYYPVVKVGMTDLDVILRVAQMWDRSHSCFQPNSKDGFERKPAYVTKIVGKQALEIMRLISPYMFGRRLGKIMELLDFFSGDKKERAKEKLKGLGLGNII